MQDESEETHTWAPMSRPSPAPSAELRSRFPRRSSLGGLGDCRCRFCRVHNDNRFRSSVVIVTTELGYRLSASAGLGRDGTPGSARDLRESELTNGQIVSPAATRALRDSPKSDMSAGRSGLSRADREGPGRSGSVVDDHPRGIRGGRRAGSGSLVHGPDPRCVL